MIQAKTTSNSQDWNANLRVKVGMSVRHLNATWTNRTGINAEPSIGNANWELSGTFVIESPFITISGNIFRIIKNPDNNIPANRNILEENDIIANGMINNNILLETALFGGGDITNFGTLGGDYVDGSYTLTEYSTIT